MSRLLENSQQLRDSLKARNLYKPTNPYQLDDSELVNTVNKIVTIIKPFSTFDLSNTVLGKAIDPNSPLAKSSLEILAIQLAATVASNANREFLPIITSFNLFDPNKTRNKTFILLKKDFQITRKETQTNLGRILDDISGTNFKKNIFDKFSTNADYIRNTGKGQLQQLYVGLGRNLYRPSDNQFLNVTEAEGFDITDMSKVVRNNIYFMDQDDNVYPFTQYKTGVDIIRPNNALRIDQIKIGFSDNTKTLEYGSTQEFVEGLGKTRINKNAPKEYLINEEEFGLNEDIKQQLVWGKDGISPDFMIDSNSFDQWKREGQKDEINPRFDIASRFKTFNIKHGILNYTKELLNIQGRYGMFDLTRKKYLDKNNELHFRGSPIQHKVDGSFDTSRQHNAIDQYDRFAKAIRFNGNKIYGGNNNSVIFNSVMPKLHPIIHNGDNKADNRNMFFSIENLASVVIRDEDLGIARLEDNFGTEVPYSEAGPSGGRIMWFPPYDIRLNEQSIARHESTVFLGRSEPIYTYSNTERIATLNFKLIIDYPPQIINRGQEEAARFIAFGDENYKGFEPESLGFRLKKLEENKKELQELDNKIELADPKITPSPSINFYFPNAQPLVGSEKTSILIWQGTGYEDNIENNPELPDDNDFGLNVNWNNVADQHIEEMLHDDKLDFMEMVIVGEATQLYTGEGFGSNLTSEKYNKDLGLRRANAVKEYVKTYYKIIFPDKKELPDYKFILVSTGEEGAPDSTKPASSIPDLMSKLYRKASLSFRRNETTISKTIGLTPDEIKRRNELIDENLALNKSIRNTKNNSFFMGDSFTPYTIEDGIFKGFNPFSKNEKKFKPVFHSQTPEDFHRRLTFLQQCVRQGPSIRRLKETSDGTFTANNAVFGRQPIQVLRIGDFFHTKIVIDNISFDYTEAPWDLNPEGMGAQFMIADITIQMRIIGGQSLKGPIDVLQNAVSFNYYGNSTFYDSDVYKTASLVESAQYGGDELTKEVIDNLNSGSPSGDNSAEQAIDTTNKLKEDV